MLKSASLLAVLLAAIPRLAVAVPDEIHQVGSKRFIECTVVSENARVVKYKPEGISQTQELDAAKVERIEYDDAPDIYKKAMEFYKAGDFENAISNFKLAASAKTRGDWAKIYSQFYIAESYSKLGAKSLANYRNAADAYEKLVEDYPDCRFLPVALQNWGLALSFAGDQQGAAAVFDQLAKEAEERKLGVVWQANALIEKAESYARNDAPEKAKDAFSKAGSFAEANAGTQKDEAKREELLEIAGRARLSEGVTLLKNEKYTEARRAFERIAQDANATESMVAGAQVGIGEVMFAEGRFKEALEQFARARVRYFLVEDQTARATYFMGLCCLKGDEPNGKRKAHEYFTEVVERYGDTTWANLAQAEL